MADNEDKTMLLGTPGGALSFGEGIMKAPKAKMVCLDDTLLDPSQRGLVLQLENKELILGRGEECNGQIKYGKVSRQHARVFPAEGRWGIEDLKSTNGVWINDVRVTQGALKPGDYVRIGAIPFRFVLDRPDDAGILAAPVASGDSEQTMMFGAMNDTRAAEALMRAAAHADEEQAKPAKPVKAASDKPAFSSAGQAAKPQKSKMGLIVGLVVVLLVGAGGAYKFFLAGADGSEEVQLFRKQVREFSQNYEESIGTPTLAELKGSLSEIDRISAALSETAGKYAGNKELREIQAQVLFMQMERKLLQAVKSNQAQGAETVVEGFANELGQIKAKVTTGPGPVDEVAELLNLAREVARIKLFRQKYPKPSDSASKQPTAEEVQAYQKSRSSFVDLKRHPKLNRGMTVTFPFFGRMVSEVDKDDLPLLDQWRVGVQ